MDRWCFKKTDERISAVNRSLVCSTENKATVNTSSTTLCEVQASGFSSASHAKLLQDNQQPDVVNFDTDDELTGFRFTDLELLIEFMSKLLCPNCKQRFGASKIIFHHRNQNFSCF